MLRGKIIKSPAGRSATRMGDSRLRRIFARGTLGQKLPKANRVISGILENTLSNHPTTIKCPAGLPGARTRRKIARTGDHRPAQSGEHFYGVHFERTLIFDLRWCVRAREPQRGPGGPPRFLILFSACWNQQWIYVKKDPALSLLATQVE